MLFRSLSGTYASRGWHTLQFEVWMGEPQGYVGDNDGPQPLSRKSDGELNGGFKLTPSDAADGLTLRYRFEGPAPGDGLGPPYDEVQVVTIDPITAGTRRRLSLTIPSNQGHN